MYSLNKGQIIIYGQIDYYHKSESAQLMLQCISIFSHFEKNSLKKPSPFPPEVISNNNSN